MHLYAHLHISMYFYVFLCIYTQSDVFWSICTYFDIFPHTSVYLYAFRCISMYFYVWLCISTSSMHFLRISAYWKIFLIISTCLDTFLCISMPCNASTQNVFQRRFQRFEHLCKPLAGVLHRTNLLESWGMRVMSTSSLPCAWQPDRSASRTPGSQMC